MPRSKEAMPPLFSKPLKLASMCLIVAMIVAPTAHAADPGDLLPYEQRRHCGPGNHRLPENVSAHGMFSKLLDQQFCFLVVMPKSGFHPGRSYRTLVLLHGLGGTPMDWINVAKFHQNAQELMAEGRIQPFITIIPAGENGYWTDWADGKHLYARLVVEEYIQAAEDLFPLLQGAEHRAIAGISMGGFGALSIALSRPDVFGFVAALSPTDMELALKSTPRRTLYLDVVGRPADQKALARVNPWHLVQSGAGSTQTFSLVYGSREAPKFSDGTKRLFKAMRGMKQRVQLREVPRAVHSWATWSGETQEWWLGNLTQFWPPDPSPDGATGGVRVESESGQR